MLWDRFGNSPRCRSSGLRRSGVGSPTTHRRLSACRPSARCKAVRAGLKNRRLCDHTVRLGLHEGGTNRSAAGASSSQPATSCRGTSLRRAIRSSRPTPWRRGCSRDGCGRNAGIWKQRRLISICERRPTAASAAAARTNPSRGGAGCASADQGRKASQEASPHFSNKRAHRGCESVKVVVPQRLFPDLRRAPMPTECSAEQFDFGVVEGRPVVAAFDAGLVTSDAGALLLGSTNRAIDLIGRFAACFRDRRCAELIEHEVATLVGQRVFGIALGYEDLNDHDDLRHDPAMAVLAGKLAARRKDCAPVAGKSTLNRLELSRAEPTRYHKIAYDQAANRSACGRGIPGGARTGAAADHSRSRCHRRSVARGSGRPVFPRLLRLPLLYAALCVRRAAPSGGQASSLEHRWGGWRGGGSGRGSSRRSGAAGHSCASFCAPIAALRART